MTEVTNLISLLIVFGVCPFVPAGAPGMEIVARASGHLPVLFLSGNGQGGHGKNSGQAGNTGHGHAHCPSLLGNLIEWNI